MGLGSTAKKLQRLADVAEKLYEKVNEVLERLSAVNDRVEATSETVEAVRREQREQRAVLEALADERGVDVDAVVEAVEHPGEAGSDAEGTGGTTTATDGGPDRES